MLRVHLRNYVLLLLSGMFHTCLLDLVDVQVPFFLTDLLSGSVRYSKWDTQVPNYKCRLFLHSVWPVFASYILMLCHWVHTCLWFLYLLDGLTPLSIYNVLILTVFNGILWNGIERRSHDWLLRRSQLETLVHFLKFVLVTQTLESPLLGTVNR